MNIHYRSVFIDTNRRHADSSFTLDSDQHVLFAGVSRRALNEGQSGCSMAPLGSPITQFG